MKAPEQCIPLDFAHMFDGLSTSDIVLAFVGAGATFAGLGFALHIVFKASGFYELGRIPSFIPTGKR
jgi:hypothetical protein